MNVQTIAEQLFFTTLRIETLLPDGTGAAGTGFFFGYQVEGQHAPFLVTNKHVIKDAIEGKFHFTLGEGDKPLIGQRFDIRMATFARRWHGHPNPQVDVAIMPLAPVLNEIEKQGKAVFIREFEPGTIPTPAQVQELDAIEEVTFVGYPNGIYDSKNLIPIARRGSTATPLQIDYEGMPCFLIDASVFPGSSGSPVLICQNGAIPTRNGVIMAGSRAYLLGLLSSVVIREEHGRLEFATVPTALNPVIKVNQMIDLGVVFKASTIVETIEDFLKQRQPALAPVAATPAAPDPGQTPTP